jgi:hypothetical protein
VIECEFTVASGAFSATPSWFAYDRVERIVMVEKKSFEFVS